MFNILILLFFHYVSICQQQPMNNKADGAADKFLKKCSADFLTFTKYDDVVQMYKSLFESGFIESKDMNPIKTVKEYSSQLGELFKSKLESLERAANFSQERAAAYPRNPKLTLEDVKYINAKNMSHFEGKMSKHPLFVDPVVLNESSVHIPTEIYEGDILHTLYWTSQLDNKFAENKNLRYQFFASVDGILRVYPGLKWRNTGVDMYDVRRRPWYVQGSSSPKDMLILIDTSGSMFGQSLSLTKLAVKKLVDTLGENDYIAVAQFPGTHIKQFDNKKDPPKPHLLVENGDDEHTTERIKCFESFVQATKRNKGKIFSQLDKIKAQGIAKIDDALMFAYRQFETFHEQEVAANSKRNRYDGANCNRIIVILTDGGQEYPDQAIKNITAGKPYLQNIRIFTYSIGEQTLPPEELIKIACKHKGYHSNIPALGAVSNIIQHHVHRTHTHWVSPTDQCYLNASRHDCSGMDIAFIQHSVFEEPFLNADNPLHHGMGLMTSLTIPLYNKTGNQTLLGVIGTDVTVKDFIDFIPKKKLGSSGYAFAINTNGYIIFHPELKAQRGWMRDPPNVDFLDLEFENEEKVKVREKIIDSSLVDGGSSGTMNISSMVKVRDEIHTYFMTNTYAYTNIPFSSFGTCVVNPHYNTKYPQYKLDAAKIKRNKLGDYDLSGPAVKQISGKEQLSLTILHYARVLIAERINEKCRWKTVVNQPDTSSGPEYSINNVTNQEPDNFDTKAKINMAASFVSTSSDTEAPNLNLPLPNNLTNESSNATESNSTNVVKPKTQKKPPPRPMKSPLSIDEMKKTATIDKLLVTLTKSESECHDDFGAQVLSDLLIAQTYFDFTGNLSQSTEILSLVISLNSGLTFAWPKEQSRRYSELKDNWKSAIFQRTIDLNILIFWVPIKLGIPKINSDASTPSPLVKTTTDSPESSLSPLRNAANYKTPKPTVKKETVDYGMDDDSTISIFRAVNLGDYRAGVVGITLNQSYVHAIFNSVTFCEGIEFYFCYLMEDAGYVIAVNDPYLNYQVGYFLGYSDPLLMNALVNNSIYSRVLEYDYQGSCIRTDTKEYSSGFRSLLPSILVQLQNLLSPQFWISIIKTLSNTLAGTLQFIFLLLFSVDQSAAQESTATTGNVNVSCIKKAYRYYLNGLTDGDVPSISVTYDQPACIPKTRELHVKWIPGTNLVMMIVAKQMNYCNVQLMERDPIKDVGPNICEAVKKPRYRRRPRDCYDFDPAESNVTCSSLACQIQRCLLFSLSALSLLRYSFVH